MIAVEPVQNEGIVRSSQNYLFILKIFITFLTCIFQTSTHHLNNRTNPTEKNWEKTKKNQ